MQISWEFCVARRTQNTERDAQIFLKIIPTHINSVYFFIFSVSVSNHLPIIVQLSSNDNFLVSFFGTFLWMLFLTTMPWQSNYTWGAFSHLADETKYNCMYNWRLYRKQVSLWIELCVVYCHIFLCFVFCVPCTTLFSQFIRV